MFGDERFRQVLDHVILDILGRNRSILYALHLLPPLIDGLGR